MDKKEDVLSIFTISLALIACTVLVYVSRTPILTGSAVLSNYNTAVGIFYFLILICIVTVIGAIVTVKRLHKETEKHKEAIKAYNIKSYIGLAKYHGFSKKHVINKLKNEGWEEKEIKRHLLK